MKKKPIPMPVPHKPRQIVLPPPEGLTEEQLKQWKDEEVDSPESYRHNNFFILYQREQQDSIIADLNGKTFFRHLGPIEEVFALINAMQAAKWQGRRVYEENFEEFSDEEFVEEGMMVLEDIMAVPDASPPDPTALRDLLDSLQGSFLDELIKPPKRKN